MIGNVEYLLLLPKHSLAVGYKTGGEMLSMETMVAVLTERIDNIGILPI